MAVDDKDIFTPDRIQTLFTEIAKLITSSLEVPKIIDAIMRQVEAFFQPHNWSLLRIDPHTNELFFVIAKGIDESVLKNFRLKIGEGIAGKVALTGKSMFIQDAQQDPNFSQKVDSLSGFKTRSLIAVPIKFQKKVLGVIELINAFEDRAFTERELTTLETIADFSAIALTNALAYERINWDSKHDALTGLLNRLALEQLMSEWGDVKPYYELERKLDTASCIVVALIDIDKFKEVNDQYGHQTGDEVLVKAADILKNCCHEHDCAFRIGGDEFLLILSNLQEKDIPMAEKSISDQLQQHSRNLDPALGFSFGIASGLKMDLTELIKKADQNMYASKAKRKEKLS